MKVKGTVKWYNSKKGFGFITDEEGKDVFVHVSSLKKVREKKYINEGDEVEFEIGETPNGKLGALEVDVTKFSKRKSTKAINEKSAESITEVQKVVEEINEITQPVETETPSIE